MSEIAANDTNDTLSSKTPAERLQMLMSALPAVDIRAQFQSMPLEEVISLVQAGKLGVAEIPYED